MGNYPKKLTVSKVHNGIILSWEPQGSFNSGIDIEWRGILLHFMVIANVGNSFSEQAIAITYNDVYYKYGAGMAAHGAGFFGTKPPTPVIETPTHKLEIKHYSRRKISLLEISTNPDINKLKYRRSFKILNKQGNLDFDDSFNEYKPFIDYNQYIMPDYEYGITVLAYNISPDCNTLNVQKIDSRTGEVRQLNIPLMNTYISDIEILAAFLIDFMSYSGNFLGEPIFISSELFTNEEFDEMKTKGIERMDERKKIAKASNGENDLIKYCISKQLNPEPDGGSLTNWKANCPSGRHHYIMISKSSNEWGCGYCKKKGKLEDLKKWYESRNDPLK